MSFMWEEYELLWTVADRIFQSHMVLQYDSDTPPIENGVYGPSS